MKRRRGIAVSVVALIVASPMAVPTPASAAPNSGTNWPTPEALGLVCDGRWGHIGPRSDFGPVLDWDSELGRQHWDCSSWTVTMTVARYPDEAAARDGQQWARDSHLGAYDRSDHLCRTGGVTGIEMCAVVPTTATGGQIHRQGRRDGALELLTQNGGPGMWAGSIGAWERRGTYVASVDSWSGSWPAWGYFSADDLAAAAAALAANPPDGLPFNTLPSYYEPGPGGSPGTARKAKARDVADAMRAWSRSTNRRYKKLTPRKTTLVRYGSSASAARAARFAGFNSSTTKQVWIKVGTACLRANAKSSGKWRSVACPTTTRWNKAR
ncbi:MAG: hypothetical protein WA988_13120 [Candidatus Nanopelagicales bacterium]|nr:hypothetical protein [Actinomycetota bacterium]